MANLLHGMAYLDTSASTLETSQTHAKTVTLAVYFVLYHDDSLEREMMVSLYRS